jgi:hypothetical protein
MNKVAQGLDLYLFYPLFHSVYYDVFTEPKFSAKNKADGK